MLDPLQPSLAEPSQEIASQALEPAHQLASRGQKQAREHPRGEGAGARQLKEKQPGRQEDMAR